MIFCDQWSSTCGLYAAELLLYAIGDMKESGRIITRRQSAHWICERDVFSLTSFRIRRLFQIISSYFSLTRVRQENREAADNRFLADDVSGKLRYPLQLIVKATSGIC